MGTESLAGCELGRAYWLFINRLVARTHEAEA
jgi:hypothetical protein